MAVTTRVNVINRAKTRAGRQAENLNLVIAYDEIVQYMSAKYPLIPHQRFTSTTVGSQSYLTESSFASHAQNAATLTPNLIRTVERFQYSASDLEYFEPELFFALFGAAAGTPICWTFTPSAIMPAVDAAAPKNRVHMYPAPSGTIAVILYCSVVNPKSTGDTYVHLLGETFDEAIFRGVTWIACEKIGNIQEAVRWKALFEHELTLKTREMVKRVPIVHHPEL